MTDRRVILVVEDNDNDAELARAAFARCGVSHELAVAADGGEALDYLRREGEHAGRDAAPVALVLLDLKLAGVDGFEVLRRVRADERTAAVPVVVFTSSVEDADIARSVRCGANSYVRKPTDFDEFLGVARLLAGYWLALHQRPPEGAPR